MHYENVSTLIIIIIYYSVFTARGCRRRHRQLSWRIDGGEGKSTDSLSAHPFLINVTRSSSILSYLARPCARAYAPHTQQSTVSTMYKSMQSIHNARSDQTAAACEMNLSSADEDLDLNLFDPYTQSALIRGGFLTTSHILKYTETEFKNKANLTASAARQVFIEAAKISAGNIKHYEESSNQVLTTGCQQIDKALGGGLFKCGITEISGESGCGKTQFCLQIALTVQLPLPLNGAKSGAAYICTEDRFPSSRIQQMISNLRFKYQCDNRFDMNELCETDYGDNILISHIATVEDLKKCIREMLPKALMHRPIKLIVIDSITAVFRGEYTLSEAPRRSRDLRDVAFCLHKLSVEHGLWIICVNQVTSSMSDVPGKKLVPSLGLSWANLVTTRLMMSKAACSRFIEVIFSPHAAPTRVPFIVTERGIEYIS